jgi:crotonobetainyl-CoA:carnitine CoA-transferase CaiB-like acyl-CoA transferase
MQGIASPLRGVKVLDLSDGVAGSFATKYMAALGAEVIKIEPPRGDASRNRGPFPGDSPHPEKSGQFLYLNTGKRGVTLALDQPDGQTLARRLFGWADVIIESFAPGVLDSWGLGFEAIEGLNPAAVLVSIAPFGQNGPYRDFRSSDIVIQALGGLLYVTGEPSREPLQIGGDPSEYFAGFSAFAGALVALTYRELHGVGQHVDVSAHEGLAVAQMYSALSYIYTGKERGRQAASPLYKVADGHVGVTLRQSDWPGFCEMMGRPELEDDERFRDMQGRRANQEALAAVINEWIADKQKEDLYQQAQAKGMTWGYICDTGDLMQSPQYQHRQFFIEIAHPVAGTLTYPGMPMKWGDSTWQLSPAPLLGQHNNEVFAELAGCSADQLALLKSGGVI